MYKGAGRNRVGRTPYCHFAIGALEMYRFHEGEPWDKQRCPQLEGRIWLSGGRQHVKKGGARIFQPNNLKAGYYRSGIQNRLKKYCAFCTLENRNG